MMTNRPGRRHSIKDSVKRILHIPREQYVPLPVGGYPLPNIIKRKFALPPRLPSVNRLSLLPDFTSSLYGEKWSEAIRQSTGRATLRQPGTPDPSNELRVRYSILIPEEPTSSGPPQIPCAIRQIPSRSRTLRRVRRRENLLVLKNRSIARPTTSDIPTLSRTTSFARASEHDDTSSEITLVAKDLGAEDSKVGARPVSNISLDSVETVIHLPARTQSEQNVLTTVIEYVPHLVDSFCILDLQISGQPIRVTTQDLLPQESISDGEAFFLDDSALGNPWEVRTNGSGDSQIHHITIEGDLIDSSGALTSSSHRFTGQLDVTNLINFLELEHGSEILDDDFDVWLEIAHEEMDRCGIRRTIRGGCHTNKTSTAFIQKEKAVQGLRNLHKDYFIIGPTGPQVGEYCITHLSPSLSRSMHQGYSNPLELLDAEALADSFNNGERFVAKTISGASGSLKRLYCLPMFGPDLSCWLCFLVDGDLPKLWYS